jgi:signal transduction histidine kinase
LLFTKDSIGLIVTDDGLGFDKLAVKNKHSFGLLGMRERVRSLGGEFDIHSSPGNGTKIQVTLPVNPATLEPS